MKRLTSRYAVPLEPVLLELSIKISPLGTKIHINETMNEAAQELNRSAVKSACRIIK